MSAPSKRITSITLIVAMVTATVIGCAQVRKLTYPPNFTYLEKGEVEALMQSMSKSIGKLDQLVTDAPPSDTVRQQKIIDELSKLEGIATQLSGDHTQTNQFVINDHIQSFFTDLGTAKMFARLDPPNYSKVDYVISACAECHQFR